VAFSVRLRNWTYLKRRFPTMSPFEHGEVVFDDDGAETDSGLGHYERFYRRPSVRHDKYGIRSALVGLLPPVLRKERAVTIWARTIQ